MYPDPPSTIDAEVTDPPLTVIFAVAPSQTADEGAALLLKSFTL